MTNYKTKLITQAAYAKQKGISKQVINRYVKAGKFTLIDGKVNPELADAEIEMNSNPGQDGQRKMQFPDTDRNGVNNNASNYRKARTLREVCLAKLAELELKLKTKEHVLFKEVETTAFNFAAELVTLIKNIPSRVAPLIINQPDQFEIEKAMKEEINKIILDFEKMKKAP